MFGKSPPLASHVTSQKSLDQSEPFETREIHANKVNKPHGVGTKTNHFETRSNCVQICSRQNQVEMASRRHSGDPKDLLLVDPSRPDATKRARKHLTKRQKDIFVQYGFSKALLQEVIGAGWDQADINNYVLYYNGQVEAALAVPAPALDMSMKRAINTIIHTKLQA